MVKGSVYKYNKRAPRYLLTESFSEALNSPLLIGQERPSSQSDRGMSNATETGFVRVIAQGLFRSSSKHCMQKSCPQILPSFKMLLGFIEDS